MKKLFPVIDVSALALVLILGACAPKQRFVTIATGGTAGTYFPLGGALAEIWNKNIKGMNATATSTGASAANIAMPKAAKVEVIFIQNDAAFNTAGAPTAAIQDLSASKKIILVAVEGNVAANLMAKWCFYTPTVIPANTYQNVASDVMTVSIKSMLAVSAKLDDKTVYEMLKTMFANADRLAASHKKDAYVTNDTSTDGMSIPLHPGAEKFYKENKK